VKTESLNLVHRFINEIPTNNFIRKGALPRSRDPSKFDIQRNISPKTSKAIEFKSGTQIHLGNSSKVADNFSENVWPESRDVLGGIAESNSAYCDTCYRRVVYPSVYVRAIFVTLIHPAKAVGRNEMPRGRYRCFPK